MQIFDLQENLKQAQLKREEVKVSTLRLLLSEIKNSEISKGHELSNAEILEVIAKEAKKRRESITSFKSARREELALKEETELKILEEYLPAQIEDEELIKIIEKVIDTEKPSLQDMGKIIRLVMDQAKGRVDGGRVAAIVKEKLVA